MVPSRFLILFLQICFAIQLIATDTAENFNTNAPATKVFKPAILRTELRFGRQLNPEKVRVVNVKSNNGENVEILVGKDTRKARAEDSTSFFVKRNPTPNLERLNQSGSRSTSNRPLKLSDFPHSPALLKQSELVQQSKDYSQRKLAAEERQRSLIELQVQKVQNAYRQGIELKRDGRSQYGRSLRFQTPELDTPAYQRREYDDAPHQYSNYNSPIAREQHYQPFYIPLANQNNFSFPREGMTTNQQVRTIQKRSWQPIPNQQRYQSQQRTRTQRQAPSQLLSFSFRPLLDAALENFNSYFTTNGARARRPPNLITKSNFMALRPQSPSSFLVSSSAAVGQTVGTKRPSSNGGVIQSDVVDGPAVTIIEGVRVPDAPEDKVKTWRNARVLNNQLVPYPAGYSPPKVQVQSFDR